MAVSPEDMSLEIFMIVWPIGLKAELIFSEAEPFDFKDQVDVLKLKL